MKSIQNISKALCIAVAGVGLTMSVVARADLAPGAGYYVFEGDGVILTRQTVFGPVSMSCVLALAGEVGYDANGDIVITVVDGDTDVGAANDSNCSDVSFTFDWPSDPVSDSSPPLGTSATDSTSVDVRFNNVSFATPIGSCSGTSDAIFRNTDTAGVAEPSLFEYDDVVIGTDCIVSGKIYVVSSSDLNDDGVITDGTGGTKDETGDSSDIDVFH